MLQIYTVFKWKITANQKKLRCLFGYDGMSQRGAMLGTTPLLRSLPKRLADS